MAVLQFDLIVHWYIIMSLFTNRNNFSTIAENAVILNSFFFIMYQQRDETKKSTCRSS